MKSIANIFCTCVLALFFIGANAQNPNQPEEYKKFGEGNYARFYYNGSKFEESKYRHDIKFKYDEKGAVNTVLIGEKKVYKVAYHGVKSDNIVNTTYFESLFDGQKHYILLFDDCIYEYNLYSDGKRVHDLLSVYGKKGDKYTKVKNKIEEYIATVLPEYSKKAASKFEWRFEYSKVGEKSEGYMRVKKNGKYGLVDSEGKLVVPTVYEKSFKLVKSGIFGVQKNGKQGYVNVKNEVVIPIEFDWVKEVKEETVMVKKGEKYAFFNTTGQQLGTWYTKTHEFKDGVVSIYNGNDVGILTKDGVEKWIFKNTKYDAINDYGEGFYRVFQDGKAGLVKKNGEVLIPVKYSNVFIPSENVCVVIGSDDKRGYYKLGYGWITEMIFDKAYNFKNGKGKAVVYGNEYECDLNGKATYSKSILLPNNTPLTPFHDFRDEYEVDGLVEKDVPIIVSKNGKKGAINMDGEIIIALKFEDLEYLSSKMYRVKNSSGKYALYDGYETNTVVTDFKYDKIKNLENAGYGEIVYRATTNTHYEVINTEGKLFDSEKRTNNSSGCTFTLENYGSASSLWYIEEGELEPRRLGVNSEKTFDCQVKIYQSNQSGKKLDFKGGGSSSYSGKRVAL